ncbi:hypothetical protein, partial [Novacetimonas hansenii]
MKKPPEHHVPGGFFHGTFLYHAPAWGIAPPGRDTRDVRRTGQRVSWSGEQPCLVDQGVGGFSTGAAGA